MSQDNSDFFRVVRPPAETASTPAPSPTANPDPSSGAGENTFGDSKRNNTDLDAQTTFRLKSVAGASFALLVLYAYIAGPGPGGSHGRSGRASQSVDSVREIRDVEQARAEQGFFKRLVCGASWKARFCR